MIQQKPYDECYFTNYDSYRDLCIYEIGKQACSPSYSYGPSIRHHYIFHYLLTGQGRLRLGDQEYTVHAHEGFIIPPNTLSYYVADSDNPWDYIWIHLDCSRTLVSMTGIPFSSQASTPIHWTLSCRSFF